MWFLDKSGNAVNSDQLLSLVVGSDGESGFEVHGQDSADSTVAAFNTGAAMDEAEANALYARMQTILGTVDLTA